MHNKTYKKAIVFAMCLTMLMPLGSMAASSTSDDAKGAADTAGKVVSEKKTETKETDESSTSSGDEEVKKISDEEALKTCEQIAENDNLKLYFDSENERLCLYVKKSGKCWWTSPINAQAEESMKNVMRKNAGSTVAIKTGDLRQEKRTESPAPVYSASKSKTT